MVKLALGFGIQRLPLEISGNVLPAIAHTTEIDVTYNFRLWALWEFRDGTIYYLARTEWSVRYAGQITKPVEAPFIYTPNANNRNNGSTGFTHDNALPDTIVAPRANAGRIAWR